MTFLPSLPFLAGAAALLDANMAQLSTGPRSQATFQTESGGLIFERNSVATCQTSATTVDSTATADQPCIGCLSSDATKRGLVMQPRTVNACSLNPRSSTGWNAGEVNGNNGYSGTSAAQTNNDAAGPDGQVVATRVQTFIGTRGGPAYSPSQDDGIYGFYTSSSGAGAPATFSMWCKGAAQMATNSGGNPSPPTTVTAAYALRVADTGAWQRASMKGIEVYQYTTAVDGRDYSTCADAPYVPSGGLVAYDCHVDLLNITRGNYVPEAIATASGVCAIHYLYYTTGSDLIAANGQIKVHAQLSPMETATDNVYWGAGDSDIATGNAVFAYQTTGPVNSYAYVRKTDRKLVVKIGAMSEIVSTNAISYAANDILEVYVAVGNNVASVAKYRIGGTGSWTDLVLATIANAPAPGSDRVYFLSAPFDGASSNDRFTWPSRLHRLVVHDKGAPAGI